MTCRDALSLLDDLVDGELSPDTAAGVREHLKGCATCRAQYTETRQLKELLQRTRTIDPGRDYWSETSDLILARTIENAAYEGHNAPSARAASARRGAFMRAFVSLAASLAILASAIIIGQGQDPVTTSGSDDSEIILTSAVVNSLEIEREYVTDDDNYRLARGMVLLSPPGLLGRFSGMADMWPSPLAGY